MEIIFTPIGILHTPFDDLNQMPVQPTGRQSAPGFAEVYDEFLPALKGLETFSHVILIYFFHQQTKTILQVRPFLAEFEIGLFATRAPSRPNKIGLSVVELEKLEENKIFFKNLDMLDGTPLLDIKPYVPKFDFYADANNGWLEGIEKKDFPLSDSRFAGGQT